MDLPTPTILREIRCNGSITLARFMELALYEPVAGYYERSPNRVGKRGDYFTSVSVGPLFGELLAARFAAWLDEDEAARRIESGQPPRHQIVEAGAHDGRLATDILGWLHRERPAVFARLQYLILEPSLNRQQWQRESLSRFPGKVNWAGNWAELGAVRGVLFSNELLDAMPMHRLVWSKHERRWREAVIAELDGRLMWSSAELKQLPTGAEHLAALPPELVELLPDGFATEVSPDAIQWWTDASQALSHGRLVTFDYGLEADQFLLPSRAQGTLRGYREHRHAENALADPGEQDLTAQVNFTAVRAAGERAGLWTEIMDSQGLFLTRVATQLWPAHVNSLWTPERVRQFQTLTHPEHFGRSFRALVQRR